MVLPEQSISFVVPLCSSFFVLAGYCLQRNLCPLLFLTPRLPAFWIGQRLNSHALELMHLDRAIVKLGLHQLNDVELKEVRENLNAYKSLTLMFRTHLVFNVNISTTK